MKTAHIVLLSAIGLSTVAIAQTTPQTTPDNNTASTLPAPTPGTTDNAPQTPAPTPDTTENVPQAPTPTVPETGTATDPAAAGTTTTPESAPTPQR